MTVGWFKCSSPFQINIENNHGRDIVILGHLSTTKYQSEWAELRWGVKRGGVNHQFHWCVYLIPYEVSHVVQQADIGAVVE